MSIDTETLITQAATTYLVEAIDEAELTAFATRIETGGITLPSAIAELQQSVARTLGPADELAALFFIVFDRAPDPTLYQMAMTALRAGSTLENIANAALNYSGVKLSNSLDLTDQEFVDTLAESMWTIRPNGLNLDVYVNLLETRSRAELLADAIRYQDTSLKYSTFIEPALTYLAVANRQASLAELEAATAFNPLQLIRNTMTENEIEPYGTIPYWTRAGTTLFLEGKNEAPLNLDIANRRATLGDTQAFKVVLSDDDKASESTITFNSSLLSGITRLDARDADSTSSAMTLSGASTIFAGAVETTMIGTPENNMLVGGPENDVLIGAGGSDSLSGGLGDDTFVFDRPSAYTTGNITTIQDFGLGDDILNLSRILGTSGSTTLSVISGVSDPASSSFVPLNTLTRDAVIVVEHAGIWPSAIDDEPVISTGTLESRSIADIVNLFANITFDVVPSRANRHVLITTDIENDADVWLIENFTVLDQIDASEIQKIGQLTAGTTDLFSILSSATTFSSDDPLG